LLLIFIVTPTAAELRFWNRREKLGKVFDSSTGFRLPNGAIHSPDVAWIRRESWEALSLESRQKFPPICPDFVIELRSRTDNLRTLQEKMREYIENGTRLGFLIDAEHRRVYVYRPAAEVECLENPEEVSGEPILPGFVLEMKSVFEF
jgi:Uma2 family endonuclease